MKILITAFDPFGGEKINPALEAMNRLRAPEWAELVRLEVPTVFGKSISVLREALIREKPDVLISLGQAGGRKYITPERVAINLMDAVSPDNEGQLPQDEPIAPGGENALFSTLPVKEMVKRIKASGIPAAISNTAGTFVCNQLMYAGLSLCRELMPETRAGFIHVPFLPEQTAGRPDVFSMPMDDIVLGIETALEALK